MMSNYFADFLQNSGLYDECEITKENIMELCDLIDGKVRLSEYCKICREKRVFSMKSINFVFELNDGKKKECSLAEELRNHQNVQKSFGNANDEWYWTNWQTNNATRIIVFPFICAMCNKHSLNYVVMTNGNIMKKIGQYPSVADLKFPELNEYNKILDKQSRKEFGRALGLYAQGIGVGAYVYLRRIFERILEKAKTNAEHDGVDLTDYDKKRVDERIHILKDYLPDMIVSNAKIYGIVSKGIHELSEEECIKYFPVLKESIIVILRQWLEKQKEIEEREILTKSLAKIASEIT